QDDRDDDEDDEPDEANHACLVRSAAPPRPLGLSVILDLFDRNAVETLAHLLAGLKERRQLLGHRHLIAGARIAAGAGLPLLGREGAEAAQLHPLAAGERVRDLAQNRID